jgi:hypothetical protein
MSEVDISYKKEDVLGYECKHITYVVDQKQGNHDLLVAKVIVHLKDGRKIPVLQKFPDYKRPYWITHKGMQNHREKKDYEYARNLQKFQCTQLELPKALAKATGNYSAFGLKQVCRSPYIYGTDVTSTCYLKSDYRNKWPDLVTLNRVAGGDIETNVHSKDQEIICMSVTHKKNAVIYYLKSWVSDIEDVEGETLRCAEEFIGDVLKKRECKIEVHVVDTPAQVVIGCLNKLHEWKPEFFGFWNIDFDISKIITALQREGIDPKDVFSDPSIPPNYRYFDFKRGNTQKVTASGKTMSINVEDRWHWLTHPATFQCIDLMPVYRNTRLANGKEPSYSLDSILKKELKITKLKFAETDHLTGLRWHEVMQEKHKIRYGVYNIFDSMTLEMLDEKTNDLASSITMYSKNSDYKNFNSNPKRLCDDMHFWYLNRPEPCVMGSSSDRMVEEVDEHVIGHHDWIVTLPSYMAAPNGLKCVGGYPNYHTLIYTHVADLDIVSTYPNVSQLLNIARETCVMEFCRMRGISEEHRREVGVNLTGGKTNAVEICQKILGAPTLDQMLGMMEDHLAKKGPALAPPFDINDLVDMNALPKATAALAPSSAA